jgi:sec-independent protein translocase protein TatB
MFDFAWTEIALIAVVALIAIGPKDLPVAIKAVTEMIKKARRMAAEFQTHVDDLVREANLDEVRKQVNEIRNFDIRGEVERAVDPDGSLRSTLATNPLATTPATSYTPPPPSDTAVAEHPEHGIDAPGDVDLLTRPAEADTATEAAVVQAEPVVELAPAFIPPSLVPPPAPAAPAPVAEAPAFVPPAFATRHPKP